MSSYGNPAVTEDGSTIPGNDDDYLSAAGNLLWQLPSVFNRLVFVAARRDRHTGRYVDQAMSPAFDEEQVHVAFARLHREAFSLWISFSQAQQTKDLTWYLRANQMSLRWMVDVWINSQSCTTLIPAGVQDSEAFVRGLAVLLLLISASPG